MKNNTKNFLLVGYVILLCALVGNVSAQEDPKVGLLLDFPLFDLPFQRYAADATGSFLKGYANPSMKQSLNMTTNFYSAAHFGAKQATKNIESPFWQNLAMYGMVSLFDLLTITAPLGDGWLHEEYHRAVLTRRGINSFNDMNKYPLLAEAVYVSRISDEELMKLHDNHPTEWRRLQTAGSEAELNLIQNLQKNNFYYDQGLPHFPLYWLVTTSVREYIRSCATSDFDDLVDRFNAADGADIPTRDFTGPDYTAWAYALFRPELDYAARGVHPSGVGINRYIKPSDLTQQEIDFLKKQGRLQWFNMLSPMFFGGDKFRLGNNYGNFAFRHVLTPFGHDLSVDILFQTPKNNLFFVIHNYNNRDHNFFGVETAIIDKPVFVSALDNKLLLTSRAMLWSQPENQNFETSKGQFGGLIGLKTQYVAKMLVPYIEIEAKTKGWVMGNPFLEDNISVNAGLQMRFKQQ
jgi:hypothetical protein